MPKYVTAEQRLINAEHRVYLEKEDIEQIILQYFGAPEGTQLHISTYDYGNKLTACLWYSDPTNGPSPFLR